MNYFSLLNLTPAFTLDMQALEAAYFKAQREFHPDRFVGKPQAERQQALSRSVDINQAYQTLKEPLSRAQYLLELQGIHVGTDNDTVKPSQALLIEAMEMRENPPKTVAPLIQESITLIGKHYAAGEWNAMAEETLRLGYLAPLHSGVRS